MPERNLDLAKKHHPDVSGVAGTGSFQEISEAYLTPAEAARGGILPVVVPVFVPCPSCQGSGRGWAFTCLWCDGQGVTESKRTVGVRLPPMTPDGTVIEVPLEGLGIHNFLLQLRVRIGV